MPAQSSSTINNLRILNNPLLLFLLVCTLAVGLRLVGITFDSLWLDECYQSRIAAYGITLPNFLQANLQPFCFDFSFPCSLSQLLSNYRVVDPLCPPLYAIILNRWLCLAGNSDLALRGLSIIFSAGTLSLTFWFVYRFFGLRSAVLVGLVQALSPFDIYYAQEARMYSLTEFTAALSCLSLILAVASSTKTRFLWLIIYSFSTVAMINSHYTTLFILAFQVPYVFISVLKQRNWKLAISCLVAWAAVCLLWLPWFDMFLQAAAIRNASFYVSRTPSLAWPFLALFARLPANWIVFLSGIRVVAYAIPLYVSAAIMLLSAGWITLRSRSCFLSITNAQKEILYSLWFWIFIPALCLWGIDVLENHRVIEMPRYLMATAPGVYILAGLGLNYLSKRTVVFNTVLVSFIIFALMNTIYMHTTHQREPWRELAQTISSHCPKDQLIAVSQYYDIVCLDRYLKEPRRQIGLSTQMGEKQLKSALATVQDFSLVTAQDGENITRLIPARFHITEHINFGHGLHLRRYCDSKPQIKH